MTNSNNFRSPITPTWCPGCNNFLLSAGLQSAFKALNYESHNLAIAYDIGCVGNMADFIQSYGIHALHGRTVPIAMGIKLANPKLTVCVVGGDGGIYGEGLNHLIAAARANSNIKVFVANNFLYSLTTGQTSPTTPKDAKTKSTPHGNLNHPLDAVALINTINPSVYARRVESTKIPELNKAIIEALKFPGFALLEITQFCAAFGKQLL